MVLDFRSSVVVVMFAALLIVGCQKKSLQNPVVDYQCFDSNCQSEELALSPQLEASATDEPAGTPSIEAQSILWAELLKTKVSSAPTQMKMQQRMELPQDLKHLDPLRQIPDRVFNKSMDFFVRYRTQFKNQKFLGMIDFTQASVSRRFYLVDLQSGVVETYLVAHGKGSDPDFDGNATKFSNVDGSLMSSLGAYMVAETYQGKHGLSIRLDGLEATNSNARSRAIVLHAADYVNTKQNPLGRSFGCPAVESRNLERLVTALKNGALLYASYETKLISGKKEQFQ